MESEARDASEASQAHSTDRSLSAAFPTVYGTGMTLRSATIPSNVNSLLYVSHFLSTWNSRLFEFGAFLFLATIYPGTLLPASVYALVRAFSAVSFSPWIGRFIDRSERLRTVRLSIIGQRVAVTSSCVILFMLARMQPGYILSYATLAALSTLACIEKFCAIMNTIAVEREWVVIIAEGDETRLRSKRSLHISVEEYGH